MNFGKTFLAALLAIVVGTFVVSMLTVLTMVGMVAAFGASEKVVVESGSVLRFDLGSITDSPQSNPFGGLKVNPLTMSFDTSDKSHTLLGTIRAIEAAAEDERIEGVYIDFSESANASIAQLEEIRAALERFKQSGKFIVAYQEAWGQTAYWFASVADKIYTNPAGGMDWTGLVGGMVSFKRLADNLNIEPVVIRHGSFKSAVEPFLLEKMSPENRLQEERLINSQWNVMLEGVSASRGVEVAALQLLADELAIDSPESAVEMKLLDGSKYRDEVYAEIESLTKAEEKEDEDPKFVSLGDYIDQVTTKNIMSKNKIAVIYAEGEVVSGKGSGAVASESMVEKLHKAAADEEVKAVVLRVNSPGGSALASEVMWREIDLLREKKPIIVSMGTYAASGGYYIAAPADAIYADKTTLTGSIGVFGLLWSGEKAYNKIGVGLDVAKTNAHSDMGAGFPTPLGPLMFRGLSDSERTWIQNSIEQTYTTFISHVAAGRNMTTEAVDAIGQGRVWTGADAKEIGLVDGFGGLVDAIALAADRVGVADDFRVTEIVETPTGLEAFFAEMSAAVRTHVLKTELGPMYDEYEQIRSMMETEGVQARMPHRIEAR